MWKRRPYWPAVFTWCSRWNYLKKIKSGEYKRSARTIDEVIEHRLRQYSMELLANPVTAAFANYHPGGIDMKEE